MWWFETSLEKLTPFSYKGEDTFVLEEGYMPQVT
jgi:hypothetical protein